MPTTLRTSRWLLFAVALFTVPVPFYLGGFEVAPAMRALFLSTLVLAVVITEGSAGWLGSLAWLSVGQSLLWLVLLFGGAALGTWLGDRVLGTRLRSAAVLLLCAGLIGMSLFEIYQTPISSRSPYSNVTGLFG